MPPIRWRSPRTGRPFGAQFREEQLNPTGNCPTCKSPLDHKPSKRLDHHKDHDCHHDDRTHLVPGGVKALAVAIAVLSELPAPSREQPAHTRKHYDQCELSDQPALAPTARRGRE